MAAPGGRNRRLRLGGTAAVPDVAAYARTLGTAVLRDGSLAPEQWMPAYERGLRAAYQQQNIDGLVAMVAVAVNRHDLDGTIEQSIVEVEFALRIAGDSPDARVLLLSIRAGLHAAHGHIAAALEALSAAEGCVNKGTAPQALRYFRAVQSMLDCLRLDYDAVSTVVGTIRDAESLGDMTNAWFATSWLVPLLLSGEQAREAGPWSRQLRLATEGRHPWRYTDAVTFEYTLHSALGGPDLDPPLSEVRSSRNWFALSRLLVTSIRNALLRRDLGTTATYVDEVATLVPRTVPGVRSTWAGFAALLDAYSVPDQAIAVEVPEEITLLNLGAALASMEAVAIAGSQAHAVNWLRAMQNLIPEGTRTASEWPVSRDRMYALLSLRAGDARGAMRALRAAAEWSDAAGFVVEGAISRLQLAEVATHTPVRSTERRRGVLRERAWKELAAFGIDPAFQAYVVAHAVGRARRDNETGALTSRETEVLRLFARGLTYREAAAEMGVTWKTVQSHAYHAYEKLGTGRRIEAVQAAQRLGAI